jgi:asparagine N-glycosylation enzyme membrane subunit Stt3
MAARLSISGWSIPTATAVYALVVVVPVLLIAAVPAWRHAANAWTRTHPIWAAAIGAAIVGVGFASWDGWLTGLVVAAVGFAVQLVLRRAY